MTKIMCVFLAAVFVVILIRGHLRNRALFKHLSGKVIFIKPENGQKNGKLK